MVNNFVFGIETNPALEAVAAALGEALRLQFRDRDSFYYGGQYFKAGDSAGEEIILHRNWDLPSASPAYPDFPKAHLLLTVQRSQRTAEELTALLATLGYSTVIINNHSTSDAEES